MRVNLDRALDFRDEPRGTRLEELGRGPTDIATEGGRSVLRLEFGVSTLGESDAWRLVWLAGVKAGGGGCTLANIAAESGDYQ